MYANYHRDCTIYEYITHVRVYFLYCTSKPVRDIVRVHFTKTILKKYYRLLLLRASYFSPAAMVTNNENKNNDCSSVNDK